VIIRDCKHPRELPALKCKTSVRWRRIQLVMIAMFCNLAGLALIPYLLDIFPLASANLWLFGLLASFNLVLFCKIKPGWPFISDEYEIACKQGIWKLVRGNQVDYARLAGDLIVWQWIIVIHLKLPGGESLRLILLDDSLTPSDMALLRRWLLTEFM
jgi:hypothetical protein